ncbi:ABC transporter permease [Leptothermofonsia sichuanensis E412]|jgi:nitrate/nitrite transport system permease protein|uniref:ABC transporter permease n=1 Tax=Leptothermofonsia sichuanensis TaxID=2917832 RepID=UPI001CA76746|nr:ABC transporter permease [Leptothermofonsia sichuanensis]QZZ18597.1 ABC transporter permease [Leptothermofonsia sichuanensis E412]
MTNNSIQPAIATRPRSPALTVSQKAGLLFVIILAVFLIVWEVGANLKWFLPIMPSASQTLQDFWFWVTNPFFDYGPNDRGIGWLLLTSLRRVMVGFVIGSAIAIPVGVLTGLSPVVSKAVDPFIQVLRPVSPLAWLPLGLALMKDSEKTALFVIAISSIWPTLANTKFGVSNVDPAYLNVARTLGASRWRTIRKVILPAAAPNIVAGLRISFAIAWLVIVAAEILLSGGIGYFIWNEWNNLKITSIITAILVIGLVGLVLDWLFGLLQSWVSFGQR